MINIAICDDEQDICAELELNLMEIFGRLNAKIEIDVYTTGRELYGKMEAGVCYDIVFLDIEFAKNEINGVEVGRLIREAHRNDCVSIVFISWEKRYAMQLFDMRPLNFLIKPLEYGKIEKTVKAYLEIAGFSSGLFTYSKGHDVFKVKIRDIVYMESSDRKLIVHLADGGKEVFNGSLKEVYNEQLKRYDFLYVHASYAVNYEHVVAIKFNQLFLADNAIPLPISQNKRSEVRERYYEILKKRRML